MHSLPRFIYQETNRRTGRPIQWIIKPLSLADASLIDRPSRQNLESGSMEVMVAVDHMAIILEMVVQQPVTPHRMPLNPVEWLGGPVANGLLEWLDGWKTWLNRRSGLIRSCRMWELNLQWTLTNTIHPMESINDRCCNASQITTG